jgi:hypothetical protein
VNTQSILKEPLVYLALSFALGSFLVWRGVKVEKRLFSNEIDKEDMRNKQSTLMMIKNMMLSSVGAIAAIFLIYNTTFIFASITVMVGCIFFWSRAYRGKVKPLIQRGATKSEAVQLSALMGLLVLAMCAFFLAFLRRVYGSP